MSRVWKVKNFRCFHNNKKRLWYIPKLTNQLKILLITAIEESEFRKKRYKWMYGNVDCSGIRILIFKPGIIWILHSDKKHSRSATHQVQRNFAGRHRVPRYTLPPKFGCIRCLGAEILGFKNVTQEKVWKNCPLVLWFRYGQHGLCVHIHCNI